MRSPARALLLAALLVTALPGAGVLAQDGGDIAPVVLAGSLQADPAAPAAPGIVFGTSFPIAPGAILADGGRDQRLLLRVDLDQPLAGILDVTLRAYSTRDGIEVIEGEHASAIDPSWRTLYGEVGPLFIGDHLVRVFAGGQEVAAGAVTIAPLDPWADGSRVWDPEARLPDWRALLELESKRYEVATGGTLRLAIPGIDDEHDPAALAARLVAAAPLGPRDLMVVLLPRSGELTVTAGAWEGPGPVPTRDLAAALLPVDEAGGWSKAVHAIVQGASEALGPVPSGS